MIRLRVRSLMILIAIIAVLLWSISFINFRWTKQAQINHPLSRKL